jgi:tRNA 2-thiouridine synthesizing protein A
MDDTETLDLCGLKCPLPALLARRHLARAAAGATVAVIADDPMAAVDVPYMCHREGFEILAIAREGAVSRMTLRKP